MSNLKVFFVKPTNKVRVELRRYVGSDKEKCNKSGLGYHNACNPLGIFDAIWSGKSLDVRPEKPPVDDPRWPEKCACGRFFQLEDEFQVHQELIYDNGLPLSEQPDGAMWDAEWWPGERKNGDGLYLIVRCPGHHDWAIDGPSNNGNGWTRTGEPPLLTVSPSIVVPGWHGHLVNGELIPC